MSSKIMTDRELLELAAKAAGIKIQEWSDDAMTGVEATKVKDWMMTNHGLDTDEQVFFYEQDFYVLSNFSAFNLRWEGFTFPTSEHAYQWSKFGTQPDNEPIGAWESREAYANAVRWADSAHDAFRLAGRYKEHRRADWDEVKIDTMRRILLAKAQRHEYVRRKLLATGDRTLIENSWRDDFWGWGPNRTGKNVLGRLWMEVRAELLAASIDTRCKDPHP